MKHRHAHSLWKSKSAHDIIFQSLLPKCKFSRSSVGDLSFTLDNADACLKISNAGSAGSSPLSCGLEAKGGT